MTNNGSPRARPKRPDLRSPETPGASLTKSPRDYPSLRSWTMAQVRSKNTTPEIAVRKAAHALGLRFRLHRSDLPGKPDIVFPARRIALFVHGCFWHQHRCKRARRPKTNTAYWTKKLDRNLQRDRSTAQALRKSGWRCAVIWECETKDLRRLEATLQRIVAAPVVVSRPRRSP